MCTVFLRILRTTLLDAKNALILSLQLEKGFRNHTLNVLILQKTYWNLSTFYFLLSRRANIPVAARRLVLHHLWVLCLSMTHSTSPKISTEMKAVSSERTKSNPSYSPLKYMEVDEDEWNVRPATPWRRSKVSKQSRTTITAGRKVQWERSPAHIINVEIGMTVIETLLGGSLQTFLPSHWHLLKPLGHCQVFLQWRWMEVPLRRMFLLL